MQTPNKKLISENSIKYIEGPNKYQETSYPLPSKFYLDVICENFSYRFGYQDLSQAKEDKEFLEKMIKK